MMGRIGLQVGKFGHKDLKDDRFCESRHKIKRIRRIEKIQLI